MPILENMTIVKCDWCNKLLDKTGDEYIVFTGKCYQHGKNAKDKEKLTTLFEQSDPLYFCNGDCCKRFIGKATNYDKFSAW